MDRWLVKIGLMAPSQRNLGDLTTLGFPHPLFPLGTQGPSFLTPSQCPLRNLRLSVTSGMGVGRAVHFIQYSRIIS